MPDALALNGVSVHYGGVIALDDVSLEVAPGKTLGLIGPNGAGKTTLINAATGIATLASGTIALGARRLDGLPPHRIARAGIARTYQNIRLFGALDVRTNLAAGAYAQPGRLSDDCCERFPRPRRRSAHSPRRARVGAAVRRSAPARDRARARVASGDPDARRAGARE